MIFTLLISLFFINITRAVDVKSSTVYSQHPIIFVHGWTGDASVWTNMRYSFYYDGWPFEILRPFTFYNSSDYSADGNMQNAEMIRDEVDTILNQTGAEKVDIIAHSMGGLSSRYYIKFLGGLNKVDDFVSFGSPHHGVSGGTQVFQPNNTFLYNLNDGDETPGGILNDTIGQRIDVIGGCIYDGTHIQGNINYTSIYSNGDTICVPIITSRIEGANNIEIDDVDHVGMLSDVSFYNLVKLAVYDDLSGNTTNNISIQGYNLFILLGFTSILMIFIFKKQKFR